MDKIVILNNRRLLMNRLYSHFLFVWAIVFTGFICSTTLLHAQPTEGIFQMGVINYGAIDSLFSSNPKTKKTMDDIRSKIIYDFHFNERGNMTVFVNDSFIHREIFLEDENLIFYTIETSETKLYCKDSALYQSDIQFAQKLDSVFQSPGYQESYNKVFQISKAPEDIKVLFGFPTIRFTKMDTTSPGKMEMIMYCYEPIRTVETLLMPKSMSPGFAMETTEYFDGNAITVGVKDFRPEPVDRNFFGVKLDQYTEVSLRDFATAAAQLGIKEMDWIFHMKLSRQRK